MLRSPTQQPHDGVNITLFAAVNETARKNILSRARLGAPEREEPCPSPFLGNQCFCPTKCLGSWPYAHKLSLAGGASRVKGTFATITLVSSIGKVPDGLA